MHVLAVLAHPVRQSYTGALFDALVSGITSSGSHTVEAADLYRKGFDPAFRPEDYNQFQGQAMPDAILAEQARVDAADALAFVFPIWWWSFPAMLKGWFDRVFSDGWAYSFEPGRSRGLLRDRPTLVLGVGGTRQSTYVKYGYDKAMEAEIDIGLLGYCGLRDVETYYVYEVEQSLDYRQQHLARARELGARLVSADRTPRVPAVSSDRPA
jgi:NAD(P)H dehydrogenase (quinone)